MCCVSWLTSWLVARKYSIVVLLQIGTQSPIRILNRKMSCWARRIPANGGHKGPQTHIPTKSKWSPIVFMAPFVWSLSVAALNCGRMAIRFNVMFIYGYGRYLLKLVWVFLSCSYISLMKIAACLFLHKSVCAEASFSSFVPIVIFSVWGLRSSFTIFYQKSIFFLKRAFETSKARFGSAIADPNIL